ncbi:hypothetical protein ACQPW3_36260 [Actinosynnema sp. CA-248983]
MPRNLFEPVVPPDRLHPLFTRMQDPSFSPARELASEIFSDFQDVDGSFVKEFQTGGFSARIFELALFAYIAENDLELERSEAAPDFVIEGANPVAIEVTTTNPAEGVQPPEGPPYSLVPQDWEWEDKAFVFQIGKALRRKLLKRDARSRAYWELPHVAGKPFVIAVSAFHNEHSQLQAAGLLSAYLYGKGSTFYRSDDGTLIITPHDVPEHTLGEKTIPSGLFGHPEARNLSGVLFSNSHTAAKFNRIGVEQGLGEPGIALLRFGTRYDFNPDAAEPALFAYVVGDRPEDELEDFAEGLHLFINPWADTPLSADTFPGGVTFHQLDETGLVSTTTPVGFHPMMSKTMTFHQEGAHIMARYAQLEFLGKLPPDSPRLIFDPESSKPGLENDGQEGSVS